MPLALDRCLGGEEHVHTLSTQRRTLLFKTAAPEEPGQPLSLPLVSPCRPGVLWRVLLQPAICRHKHLRLLPATQMSCLSFLPHLPPAAPPPLSPETAIQMGVQTAGRCSRCSPASPGTGQLTLPHQYLGSWVCKSADGAQVCPAFRKPTKNRGQCLERGHLWARCLYLAQSPF